MYMYVFFGTVILVYTLCTSSRHSVNNINMPLKQADGSYVHVKVIDDVQMF